MRKSVRKPKPGSDAEMMPDRQQDRLPRGAKRSSGYFGQYGGRFVPETLLGALDSLENAYRTAGQTTSFRNELDDMLSQYAGRPTPLYLAKRLTERYGRGQIYLKREDLLHTGAHKINNTIGQILLARHIGKRRIIAETGAGQHGVATATVAAVMGMDCSVFMGTEDMRRQQMNVTRMRILGAEVISLDDFREKQRDCYTEAIRLEEVADRLAMSSRLVIVEGVCLQAVLERLSVTTDATVYVKLYSSHGEWMGADEYDVSIPVEDVLRDLRSRVKRVSAAMGHTPAGLSGLREEIIRYHHEYRPWEETLIFRRTEVD